MTDQTPGCGTTSDARKRLAENQPSCVDQFVPGTFWDVGFRGYVIDPSGRWCRIDQLHLVPADPDSIALTAAIENVRRYATLSLDSISVERRAAAEDVLSILAACDG